MTISCCIGSLLLRAWALSSLGRDGKVTEELAAWAADLRLWRGEKCVWGEEPVARRLAIERLDGVCCRVVVALEDELELTPRAGVRARLAVPPRPRWLEPDELDARTRGMVIISPAQETGLWGGPIMELPGLKWLVGKRGIGFSVYARPVLLLFLRELPSCVPSRWPLGLPLVQEGVVLSGKRGRRNVWLKDPR